MGKLILGSGGEFMRKSIHSLIIFMFMALHALGAVTITKSSDVNEYLPGETISYTIRVENDSVSTSIDDLVITDDMSGLALENFGTVTASTNNVSGGYGNPLISGGIFSAGSFVLESSDGTNNRYVEYTFTADVSTGATGDIINTASANATVIAVTSDSVTIPEFDDSQIEITKTANVSEYDNGDDIEYTVKVTNNSNKKIEGLTITDSFFSLSGISAPQVISATFMGGGSSTGTYSSPSAGIDFVATDVILDGKDSSVTYVLKGTVDEGVSTTLESTATATGTFIEKSVTPTGLERTVYDYSVTMSTSNSSYTPGETVTYILTLVNNKDNTVKGLEVTDILSTLETTVLGGVSGLAFNSESVSATTTGTGSEDGLVSNPVIGDLEAEGVVIGPDGSVTYTIVATVNSNVVGDISNSAEVKETTRNDNTLASNEITLSSTPSVSITQSSASKTTYYPQNEITYTITVENSGSGIAESYDIKHMLSTISTDLANDSNGTESSTDITGNPFSSGSVTITSIGANSTSSNYAVGSPVVSTDLDDKVTLFPGESISYEVKVVTDSSAIGVITSQVAVTDGADAVDSGEITINPENLNSDDIEIIKTTDILEYSPGDTVTYSIEVTNNDTEKFANNISIIDSINSITATQLDGSTDKAFSSWTLNVVSPTNSSNGTKPGTGIVGTSTTDDISIEADLAPGETIVYNLVAVISETTVGTILDGVDNGSDNVPESGNGIKMGPSKLSVSKNVDNTEYYPNSVITYEIIVENDGEGYATDIDIEDILSAIKSDTGATAYSSWEITSTLEPVTTLAATGNSGLVSEPFTGDLDVTATIGPKTRLIYEIKTTIDGMATGKITNTSTVDGTLVADRGIFDVSSDISISKSVAGSYVYEDTNSDGIADEDFVVTYTVTVGNDGEGGYASGVSVEDDMTGIEITALEGTSTLKFDSWELTDVSENGNGTSSTAAVITNGVLTDTANVTAGGSVVYTIKATVSNGNIDESNIPYGSFTNTATIDGGSASATTGPEYPSLSITKTADKSDLSDNKAQFTVRIENSGSGYANDAVVKDPATGLSNLTVIESKSGLGTDPSIGADPTDITTGLTVDIAPGGWVEYQITGEVAPGTTLVSNTAEVTDTQNNLTYEASAKIDNNTPADIEITKTANSKTHNPGGTIIYTITVTNKSSGDIDFSSLGYRVEDLITGYPDVNLANEGVPSADITGDPFRTWTITRAGMSNITDADLVDQPTITGGGSVTYTVTAILKDTILSGQKITNTAEVKNSADESLALASVQTNGDGGYGGRSVSLDKEKYIPGEELTYTIRFAGGSDGYYNNFQINEALSSMTVKTLDGSLKHPFVDAALNTSYTITRSTSLSDSIDGNSNVEVDFPSGGTSLNTDLAGSSSFDLAPGDYVEYKVTGTVRPDAVGTITYSGQSSEPYRHNLTTVKKLSSARYTPGESMTFEIEISNKSDGNADDISITDAISSLQVELSDGTTGDAFEPMEWTITTESESEVAGVDYTGFVNPGALADDGNINTTFDLPINTKVTYFITGIVNPKAVGEIENVVIVDGDTVTGQARSGNPDISSKKEINAYYDRDGSTEITGGYKPGGWIEYLITMENDGTGIKDNLTLVDEISKITSNYVDGTLNQPAFSTWNISVVESTGDATSLNLGTLALDTSVDDTDLNGTVDLSPVGKIVIKIMAQVDERAVGDIENIAVIGGTNKSGGTSSMLDSSPVISKKAYTANVSGNITSTEKTLFNPGDTFYYKIRIDNYGNGTSMGTVTDALSNILAGIPETGTNGTNPTANPFSSWEITAVRGNDDVTIGDGSTYNNGNDNVTTLGTFGSGPVSNSDLLATVYIAPGGYLEYTIKAVINDNVLTGITNEATYSDGNIDDSSTIEPVATSIELTKSITYIGADPDTLTDPQTNYSPGDYVVYEITVENTGDVFGNNILIKDEISKIKAEVAGGTTESVFESWEITDDGGSNSYTYVPAYNAGNDMSIEVDIAPKDTITFIVNAKTKETLIGIIPVNTVSATSATDASSGTVDPKDPKIEYYQTFIEGTGDTATESTDNYEYIPYGNINYRIVVENNGEGYGNNVSVKSILENLISGGGEDAFSGGTSYIIIKDKDGNSTLGSTTDGKNIVTGTTSGSGLLDVNLDIEPGGRVEFYLTGTVEGRATGNIASTVVVTGGDASIPTGRTDTVTAILTDAEVAGYKTANATYTPGGTVSFDLEIRNNTDSTAVDIDIKDILENITVETADGTDKAAFKTGTVSITGIEVLDDEDNSDISELVAQAGDPIDLSSGAINATVTLGSRDTSAGSGYSALKINIEGEVIDDATGIITNTMTYTYNGDTNSATSTTNPETGVITITNTAITSETDETEDTTYTPGEDKTFLVEVTNTGSGYANGVDISDIITGIKTELAGQFADLGITEDFAFDTTSTISVLVETDGTDYTYQVGGSPVVTDGFTGTLNIHPGDTYKIKITGKIKDTAIGDITTTASATYNGTTVTDDAKVSSVDSDVSIKKEISLDDSTYGSGSVNYEPGDTLYYKVIVSNDGSGWANDVTLEDKISEITSEISGTTGNGIAFDPSTISISYDTTAISSGNIVIDTGLDDLYAKFDLAPGTDLEFYISAVVNSNVLGDIESKSDIDSLSGDVTSGSSNTVKAIPSDAEVSITKILVGGATDYSIGEELHYQVAVKNTADSFANNVKITDDISSITVKTSEGGGLVSAFSSFTVGDNPVFSNTDTKLVSEDYTDGINVTVDLAPGDTITFDIYATVIGTAIGDIVNTASHDYTDNGIPEETSVTLNPKKADISITMTTDNTEIIPGEEAVFYVTIENTGDGIADDLLLSDDLSQIITELSGGTTGRAIESGSVSASVSDSTDTTLSTSGIDVTGDKVTATMDIAPGGKIVFKIIGTINKDVVGAIENTADYSYINNGDNTPTTGDVNVNIVPGNSDVTILKTANIDPNLGGYIPGGDVEFEITVSNTGPGIANDINISDKLSEIKVETTSGDMAAFSSWTITNEAVTETTSYIPGYASGSDLDIDVDIAPGDTLTFKIVATVIEEAFGDITNTATATYKDNLNNDGLTEALPVSSEATFIPSRSNVEISIEVDKSDYAPGDELTYTITLKNTGPGIAKMVNFKDALPQAMTTTGLGSAFADGSGVIVNTDPYGGATEDQSISVTDNIFTSKVTLPRDGYIVYTVKGTVADDVIGTITNTAEFDYTDNDGTPKSGSASAGSSPKNAEVAISKVADLEEYIAGKPIVYTIQVKNTGDGIANDVNLTDLIMDIEVESISDGNIKAFESCTITDNRSDIMSVSSIGDYDPEKNLDVTLDIAPGDTIQFVITGVTDSEAAGDIVNTAEFQFVNNDGTTSTGNDQTTSKVILNDGELVLTKEAFKEEIEQGEAVEYEILVRNTTNVYFTGVSIEDRIPAGFDYIDDTTEMTLSGLDGVFDSDDDEDVSDEPVESNSLSFTAVDIAPGEIFRIRYLLRAGIGTTFGKYENTAYAVSGGKVVSNIGSAIVEVIPDYLFDTASIIGKVYEDLNGDGYQADATANNITLKGGVSVASYVPDSTTIEIAGEITKIPDASPPLQHGIKIERLRGVSRNRKIKEPNKAIIRYETKDTLWEPIRVTTKAGSDILIDENGKVTKNNKKDVKKGLASENLKITRNIYRQKNRPEYLHEIIVENLGIYEDGIPGIRLITVEGIVIETDEFGRYHVPDEWVLRSSGKNFIVKVDEDSIPQGMRVISENPRVRRITANGLNKFNFSIQRVEDDNDIGTEEGIIKIEGDEND